MLKILGHKRVINIEKLNDAKVKPSVSNRKQRHRDCMLTVESKVNEQIYFEPNCFMK